MPFKMSGGGMKMGLLYGSSGGGAPPAFTPLATAVTRPVAARTKGTFVSSIGSDGVNTWQQNRIRHMVFPGWDATGGTIQLAYANRCAEANGFNSITVSQVRIEYPAGSGTWYAGTFGAGAASSVTIGNTSEDQWCTVTGLPTLTGGTYFNEEVTVNVASVGQQWPLNDDISLSAANGEGQIQSTSSIAPGSATNSDAARFYGATAIRGLSKAPYAVGFFGDSIINGAQDDLTRDYIGWASDIISPLLPCVQFGTSSEKARDFNTSHTKRMGLADAMGITNAFVAIGTNDATAADTLATMETSLTSYVGTIASRPWRVTLFPVLARTTSSNSWIDASHQTVATGYGVGGNVDQLNTFLQGFVGSTVDTFIDTRTGWQDAANKIVAPGGVAQTGDGTHPNAAGNLTVAANTTGFTAVASVPTPVKTYAFESLPGLVGYYDATDGTVFPDNINGVQTQWKNKAAASGILTKPSIITQTATRNLAASPNNGFAGIACVRGGAITTNTTMAAPAADPVSSFMQATDPDWAFIFVFNRTAATLSEFVGGWSYAESSSVANQAILFLRATGSQASIRYGRTGDATFDVSIGQINAGFHIVAAKHIGGATKTTTAWVDSITPVAVAQSQISSGAMAAPQFSLGNTQGGISGGTNPWAQTGFSGNIFAALAFSTLPSDAQIQQAITDLAAKFSFTLS